ncbi:hypothetical protein ONZ45_g18795 [Pleurotus djamor]|nr:hypothetical protein ONZ45_g18795 [Pleurotus djamor]
MKLSEMPKPSKALYDALLQWRKRHAIEVLGENAVYQYGARFFMPDRLVKQVVACAAAGNLRSVADMDREELQWYDWGGKVQAIVD